MIQHHIKKISEKSGDKKPAKRVSHSSSAGFSLVEILVVITLMGLIAYYMLPNLGVTFRVNMENSVREVATMIRSAYDESALKGRVYRVAFDLDKGEYWVEQGPQNITLLTEEQVEEEARKDSRRTDEEKKAVKKPVFGIATGLMKDKKSLPYGVVFHEIINSSQKKPYTTGIVYGHVFPHGIMEKLTIYLKDKGGREATLMVDPVNGKSRYFGSIVKEEGRR